MAKLHGHWRLRVHHRYAPFIKALRKMGDKSASYKIPLRRFAVKYAQEIESRFNRTEGAKGTDWPDWSEDYARRTESRALGVMSGDMSESLTNAARATLTLGDFKLVYGLRNAPYAVAFNFGRKGKNKQGQAKIPKRDFMGWNRKMSTEINELLADHQREIMTRALKRFGVAFDVG